MKTNNEIVQKAEDYRLAVYENYKMISKLSNTLTIAAFKEAHYTDSKSVEIFASQFANRHGLEAAKNFKYDAEPAEKVIHRFGHTSSKFVDVLGNDGYVEMAAIEDMEQVKSIYEAFKRYEERES